MAVGKGGSRDGNDGSSSYTLGEEEAGACGWRTEQIVLATHSVGRRKWQEIVCAISVSVCGLGTKLHKRKHKLHPGSATIRCTSGRYQRGDSDFKGEDSQTATNLY